MSEKVTKEEFYKLLEGEKLIFVDMFATWCGPCQMMMPLIDEITDEYRHDERIELVKVDIDENPDIAASFNVMSVPTFLFIKNGKVSDSIVGATSKDIIVKKIDGLKK